MQKTRTFFGHPVGLASLFATELWERFSYYGMRALLVLFLTATLLNGGFGMSEAEAFTIYGIFTGLVYLTPLIGGIFADKVIGQRKCIYIGGISMALGQFALATGAYLPDNGSVAKTVFYCGLGMLILGNGFFKPNISSMVGSLYEKDDPKQDGGFTIFYMGINIGSFLAPLIAGKLGEQVAWHYGYLSAGIGMMIGTVWFYFKSKVLGNIGMPPGRKGLRLIAKDWVEIVLYVLGCAVVVFGVVTGIKFLNKVVGDIIIFTVVILGGAYLIRSIIKGTNGKAEWNRIWVIVVLAVFNIFFWSGYEQAGTTLNVFARDNTQRIFGNFEIPASWFQSLNPILIVILAPVFSIMWTKLEKIGHNPNTPMKFAWGMFLLCFGFVVMAVALDITGSTGKLVSPMWLFFLYFFNTCGELCLSPIGLSMVTKLAPERLTSIMMGFWLASFAVGNFMASQMKSLSQSFQQWSGIELNVFWFIVIEAFLAGVILLVLNRWLSRMMQGVK